MNITQVRDKARSFGLKPGNAKKSNLIKTIQIVEGNFDCFASAIDGFCDQTHCIWREDCMAESKRKKSN